MKKTSIVKKLTINKTTVANLNSNEMSTLKAGNSETATCPENCRTTLAIQCTYGCVTVIAWYCGTSEECSVPC
ncbi:MAG: class I lanthipeptide [Acidobacteria bacterium]|jgi:hypothetical protein|nr:class I lanthipeptide [Acidobacteriota bacterium]